VTLRSLHGWGSWVVIVANGGAGLWALAAARWPGARHPALWWFTGFAQVMVFVEVVLGVGLMAGQELPAPQFHTFYGFLGIIAVAIVHSYRQQLRHRLYLLYGLGGLFVMGLAIRAALLK
jgi:hypothetical protein